MGTTLKLSPATSDIRVYTDDASTGAPWQALVSVTWLSDTTICLGKTLGKLSRADLILVREKLRELGATQALVWRKKGRQFPTGVYLFDDGGFSVYLVPLQAI